MNHYVDHYEVTAHNSAKSSENRMHDDAVAKSLGYAGGLVPGVDLVAYLSHLAVLRWGTSYFAGGELHAKLVKPVYEGDLVSISANNLDERLDLVARAHDEICVEAYAAKADADFACNLSDYVAPDPPEDQDRPAFDESSLPVGSVIAARPYAFTRESHAEHLESVRETIPLYSEQQIIHPGSLSRRLNWALTQNFRLGPWIHSKADLRFVSKAHVGEELTALAKVKSNIKKGPRQRIELDGLIVANGTRLVSIISHTVIIPV